MHGDVFLEGRNQFGNAAEDTPAQPFGGQVAEEALDHVQPRRRGRVEVNGEAWMLCQPLLHLRMLVRGMVVADQMQRLLLRCLAVDVAQKGEPLVMPVALLAARDDRPIQGIESSKLRRRPGPLVIVRHRGGAPLL